MVEGVPLSETFDAYQTFDRSESPDVVSYNRDFKSTAAVRKALWRTGS
jgi:hypothetical protein